MKRKQVSDAMLLAMKPLNECIGELESQNTKLLQAVNDKDQELFESQELVTELLEALEKIARFGINQAHPPSDLLLVQVWANKAIRKVGR